MMVSPFRLYKIFTCILQVNSQPQSTVIDTSQFGITEEAMSNGIDDFFVVDGQKLPLSDVTYALYLCWCDIDFFIFLQCQPIAFVEIHQHDAHQQQEHDYGKNSLPRCLGQ